jgi:aryl-alcohol dehydrogenase-like predicted oxidoreductase
VGPDREFGPGDQRRADPRFSIENRKKVAGMLDAFKPIADTHGATLTQLVIAWTFHQDGVTHVLCGARNVGQAQENAVAGDIQLGAEDLKTMNRIVEEHAKTLV